MPPHAGGSVSSHHVGGFGGDGPRPRSGLLRARRVQRRRVAAVGDYPSDDTHWDLPRQSHICRGERGEVQAASELDADSERICAAGEVEAKQKRFQNLRPNSTTAVGKPRSPGGYLARTSRIIPLERFKTCP